MKISKEHQWMIGIQKKRCKKRLEMGGQWRRKEILIETRGKRKGKVRKRKED